jgi:peptidylprolyl isomerase
LGLTLFLIIGSKGDQMNRTRMWILWGGLILVLCLAACRSQAAPEAADTGSAAGSDTAASNPAPTNTVITTDSGLQYMILEEGSGEMPQVGDGVRVHYTGTLEDGTQFDSSVGGEPFQFTLGVGDVIAGWDEGIALLKEGSKARLTIPPGLAYGDRANGPIPANSTLIFEVELVDVLPR